MAGKKVDFDRVCEKFGIEKLSSTQKSVLGHLTAGKDVFMSIKTGGGKSLCYQAFPVMSEGSNVLVISPLLAIMEEQCKFLTQLGFSASYVCREVKRRGRYNFSW